MGIEKLTPSEQRRYIKLERILPRGRFKMGLSAAAVGAFGGLLFAILMRLAAPCFGCKPLGDPSLDPAASLLDRLFFQMSSTIGMFETVVLICMLVFALAFGAFGLTRAWTLQNLAHRKLQRKIG